MSLAQNIVEIVQETMNREKVVKLKEVAIQVGELVAVVPESLEFCFTALVENTSLDGARLTIEVLPLTGSCQECKKNFQIMNFLFVCPTCHSTRIDITQGQELTIRHLEVE